MPSLQRRLLFGTALGTTLVLLVAGIGLHAMVRAALFQEFDNALRDKATTLAALIEQDGDRIELEFTEADMAEFTRSDRPQYFQVWLRDGTVVERSHSLGQANLLSAEVVMSDAAIREVKLRDGRRGRVVTVLLAPRLSDETSPDAVAKSLTFALARDVADVEATLAKLMLVLVLVGVLATVTSLGVLRWVVRIGLKPIDRIAREISEIDERRLAALLDGSKAPRELQPIVARLNDLLQRIDKAFVREKTMTADVAHELRTPLSGMRTTLEVALSKERDPASYQVTRHDTLSICKWMQTVVENLLALARLDAGNDPIRREPADIAQLLHDAWQPFGDKSGERQLRVHWEVEPGLSAITDSDKLRLVFNNVLGNAAHHTNSGGIIRVEATRVNGEARIRVSNTGSRVSTEEVERVFDRFWRGDLSREGAGVHCGLGLSLCRTLVERLGGSIMAESSAGGFFTIAIRL
ncbi:MAG: ATP-binding protein [Planctomycetota bacterium]